MSSTEPSRTLRNVATPYVLAVALTLATLLVRQAFFVRLHDLPLITFAIPIFLATYLGGPGPGVLATVLSALCLNYLVLPPAGSFTIKFDVGKLVILTSVCIAATVASEHRDRTNRKAAIRESDLRAQIEMERGRLALHQSDVNLRLALEAGRLGSWELDVTTGKAATTSHRHNQIFGYDQIPSDWGYDAFLRRVLPEDRDSVASCLQTAVETEAEWHFECRILRIDGEVRWIESYGSPFRDPAGKLVCLHGIVADITEQKTTEAQTQFRSNHNLLTELPPALIIRLTSTPGKEAEVQELLRNMLLVAQNETATVRSFGLRFDSMTYGIFSAFLNEEGLGTHLASQLGFVLAARASEVLDGPALVDRVEIIDPTGDLQRFTARGRSRAEIRARETL